MYIYMYISICIYRIDVRKGMGYKNIAGWRRARVAETGFSLFSMTLKHII